MAAAVKQCISFTVCGHTLPLTFPSLIFKGNSNKHEHCVMLKNCIRSFTSRKVVTRWVFDVKHSTAQRPLVRNNSIICLEDSLTGMTISKIITLNCHIPSSQSNFKTTLKFLVVNKALPTCKTDRKYEY